MGKGAGIAAIKASKSKHYNCFTHNTEGRGKSIKKFTRMVFATRQEKDSDFIERQARYQHSFQSSNHFTN